MVLHSCKDNSEEHCDSHGDSCKYAKATELRKRARETDEKADDDGNSAEDDTASCVPGEGVQELGPHEDVECYLQKR